MHCFAPLVLCANAVVCRGDEIAIHRDLITQLRTVQFNVVSGRILALSQFFDRNSTSTAQGPNHREERLVVNLTAGLPIVEYSAQDDSQRLQINVHEGNSIRIEREHLGDMPRSMLFEQQPQSQLLLRVRQADHERALRAQTLWHLLLTEPELVAQDLLPVLEALHPGWDLASTARRVEEALVRAAAAGRIPDRRRWAELVAELGSPDFSVRREADRRLRSAGQTVVPFLQGLAADSLDAEQRFRVRQILKALGGELREDSPQTVAAWLVADPKAWFCLLSRDDESLRRLATQQIQALSDVPIEFDPTADASTRAAQIERLRPRFESAPPSAETTP